MIQAGVIIPPDKKPVVKEKKEEEKPTIPPAPLFIESNPPKYYGKMGAEDVTAALNELTERDDEQKDVTYKRRFTKMTTQTKNTLLEGDENAFTINNLEKDDEDGKKYENADISRKYSNHLSAEEIFRRNKRK